MVAVGIFNLIVAAVVFLFFATTVDQARFLSTDDKAALQRMLTIDQAGNGKKVFKKNGLWDVFLDVQVWLLALLTIMIVIPSGVITTFSAILIRNFGYTAKQSALLNMPSGVVSITASLGATYAILKGLPRWLSIILILLPQLVGAGLMSFLPAGYQGGKLAGIYLINTTVAPMAIIYSWVGANTAGYTKRVGANVMIQVGFSVANIIGPQTFQARDAPQYLPAKITIFGVAGGAMLISVLLRLVYGSRNKVSKELRAIRLAEAATGSEVVQGQREDATDRTDVEFVYVY